MKLTALILFTAVLAACGQKAENPPQGAVQKPAQIPQAVTAATASASAPVSAPSAVTGKVMETMNAGGYTYLRIATASGDVWAAVGQTTIKKGAAVSVAPQMVAENFESKSLNRKFDRLVMGTLMSGEAAPSAIGTPAQHMTSASDTDSSTKVDKASGGVTIAEAWAEKAQLKDKPLVIRGKVVKFLPGIMGKNWLHLRDGSGDHSNGTDDITVTTNDVAKIGDVVVARGTLHLDKDFGAGYRYPIIVEDARLGQ
jgi:hypothetical protein